MPRWEAAQTSSWRQFLRTNEPARGSQGETKKGKKNSIKSSVCIGIACGLFFLMIGFAHLYLNDPSAFSITSDKASSEFTSQKPSGAASSVDTSPISYVPTVTTRTASYAPGVYYEGDKLIGTLSSIEGTRLIVKLENDIRVGKDGVKLSAKKDTLEYADGLDTVCIDVAPDAKVLLRVDGWSNKYGVAERVYGDLGALSPGMWVTFIWTRPQGSSEPLLFDCISLVKNSGGG